MRYNRGVRADRTTRNLRLPTRRNEIYGYRREPCGGTMQERSVDQEAFKYRTGFVILERTGGRV